MFLSIFVYLWRDLKRSPLKNPKGKFTPVHWAQACFQYAGAQLNSQKGEVLSSLDWSRNIFFVANHQSYFDIPAVIGSAGRIVGFIAKYELTRNPIVHYWMKKIGCVAINRKDYTAAIRSLKSLAKRGKPAHLVIFPEGTRSKNGTVGPLKAGGLKIAWQLNSILVPITIKGTRNIWESRGKQKANFEAQVSFGEPIDLAEKKSDLKFPEFFQEFEESFQAFHQKKQP